MMMMVCASPGLLESDRIPSVVVVDPRFDEYKVLAASARQGRLQLHFRSSGAEAMKLAPRLDVDAWLVATDLDDMSGQDLLALLNRERAGETRLIVVGPAGGSVAAAATEGGPGANAVDGVLRYPVSIEDVELMLGIPAAALAARHAQFSLRQRPIDGVESAQARDPRTAYASSAPVSSRNAS